MLTKYNTDIKNKNKKIKNTQPEITAKKHNNFGSNDIQQTQQQAPSLAQLPIPLHQDMQLQSQKTYNPKTPLPEPYQGIIHNDSNNPFPDYSPPTDDFQKKEDLKVPHSGFDANSDVVSEILAKKMKKTSLENNPQQQFNQLPPPQQIPLNIPPASTPPFPNNMPPGIPANMQPPPNMSGPPPPENDPDFGNDDSPYGISQSKKNRIPRKTDPILTSKPLFAPVPSNYPEAPYLNSFEDINTNQPPTPPGQLKNIPPPPPQYLPPDIPINQPPVHQGNIPGQPMLNTNNPYMQQPPNDPAALGLNPAYFNNASQFIQTSATGAKKKIATALIVAGTTITTATGFLVGKSKQIGTRGNIEKCRSFAGNCLDFTNACLSSTTEYIKNSLNKVADCEALNLIKKTLFHSKKGSAEYLAIKRKTTLTTPEEVEKYSNYIRERACSPGKRINIQFSEENYASKVLDDFLSKDSTSLTRLRNGALKEYFNLRPDECCQINELIDNITRELNGLKLQGTPPGEPGITHIEKAINKSAQAGCIPGTSLTVKELGKFIDESSNKDNIIENIGKLRGKLSTSKLSHLDLGKKAIKESRESPERLHDLNNSIRAIIDIVKGSPHNPERIPKIKIVLENKENAEALRNIMTQNNGVIPPNIDEKILGDINRVGLEYENQGWIQQIFKSKNHNQENNIIVNINGQNYIIRNNI